MSKLRKSCVGSALMYTNKCRTRKKEHVRTLMDACRHLGLPHHVSWSLQLPSEYTCSLSPYQCYELQHHSDQIPNQSWSVGPYLCRIIIVHVGSSTPSRAFSWTMQMIILEQDVVTGSEPHQKGGISITQYCSSIYLPDIYVCVYLAYICEHWKTDAFKLWCWRRLLRVHWTAGRSNQSILKEINLEYSLEGVMLKLNSTILVTWC